MSALVDRVRAAALGQRHNGYWTDAAVSLLYFAIGFSPITALAVAIVGIRPMYTAAFVFVLPSVIVGVGLGLRYPSYGKLALKGMLIGLLAVTLYDCFRVPFILIGAWGDFIPSIGEWLLKSQHPNFIVGCTWRYIGDGGGMGIAFTVAYCLAEQRLQWKTRSVVLAGVAYGIAIWCGLMLTILIAPHGQQMMFRLTRNSVVLSFTGHVIYGGLIGVVLSRVLPRRKPVLTLLRRLRIISAPSTADRMPEPVGVDQPILEPAQP